MTRSSRRKKDSQQERRFESDLAQRFPQPSPPVEPVTVPAEDAVVAR